MAQLLNLPDSRRDKKPFLPPDDRDVSNGFVLLGVTDRGYHAICLLHGAMNRVHPYEPYWRCSEQFCGLGAEVRPHHPS